MTTTTARTALIPNGDRVLIRPDQTPDTTPGGIVLPENAKEKPLRGTIVAVGGGRLLENGELFAVAFEVGERVVYTRFSGTEIEHEGETLLVMRADDVIASEVGDDGGEE